VKAVITGMGWVTATTMGYGRNRDSFEWRPGQLPEIARKDVFKKPYPHFGRLDRYSRLGLSAIAFALQDAELSRWTRKRNLAMIASTSHGCLDTDINYFSSTITGEGRLASPHLFAYTLPNSFLGEASIFFGLTGANFVISEPSASGLWCLRMALIGIAGGRFGKVICGRCDLNPPPFIPEANTEPCGALFFVIEKKPTRRQVTYGRLCLETNGALKFDDDEIENLPMLAEKCLSAVSKKGMD
jgi:3-oxoacyl-[acyl-carrier-protein] synthase II